MKAEPRHIQPVGLTVDEMVRATGLGRTSLYQEIAAGRLRTFKVGRRRLATPAALEQWAADQEKRSGA